MESEKVKEIKEALEFQRDGVIIYLEKNFSGIVYCKDILTLINELESENAELKRYKLDWLNSEKMHLQADMEETEFELSSSNRLFEIVSKENQALKDRIAELEEENAKLNIELDKKDCIDYPCRLIEKEHLKQFVERLREKAYPLHLRTGGWFEAGVDYAIPFYKIDETLKEMINEKKNP